MTAKIKLGISSCLLGRKVRYDGGHKLDRFIRDTLGQYVHFVPVCPEVESGLPIPRESMRLVGDPQHPRLLTTRTAIDHTERMKRWAKKRLDALAQESLCGFIFKSKSPSSGMLRVNVYNDKGMPQKTGSGIFAKAFMERFPGIPVQEEGRLHDPKLRENFIEQLFAMQRWRALLAQDKQIGPLVGFHTREKLLLMSHSPKHYSHLGKLVANGKRHCPHDLYDAYGKSYVAALRLKTTTAKNSNVLQHILGYFKKQLSADEKQEMLDIIEAYRTGSVPLIVPITLANHYVRKYGQDYLAQQSYLNPHPIALQLRNHV
ncbi:MAG: DUF523 and DUF1722 domain-containing protein [Desulfatitalea sp.]|nr:DUF523 and DUF1722 domain-containing protein [Desulfatitalea sp.]NNK01498.1 DUF523 and DUF1722 domain-containing protein [Desulfatitalea sp.]